MTEKANSQEIRTFRGRNMTEVMQQIREEVGEDAVIVSTKTLQPTGASKNRSIEVTVTTDGSSYMPDKTEIEDYRLGVDDIFEDFEAILQMNGLSAKARTRLIRLYKHLAVNFNTIDLAVFARVLREQLSLGLKSNNERRVLAFVGPTGVGKTTTIAKLALQESLERGRSVALITTDQQRVGGAQHLQQYAALAGFPIQQCSSADELKVALKRFENADRVFIDTAGNGPWDDERLLELQQLLEADEDIDRMLLLSASGNGRDLRQILTAFRQVGISSIGVTKTDETCYFGPCINTLFEAKLPIEVFGTGQNVPDDLDSASAEAIVQLLIKFSH